MRLSLRSSLRFYDYEAHDPDDCLTKGRLAIHAVYSRLRDILNEIARLNDNALSAADLRGVCCQVGHVRSAISVAKRARRGGDPFGPPLVEGKTA
jgi:hypothetical protein